MELFQGKSGLFVVIGTIIWTFFTPKRGNIFNSSCLKYTFAALPNKRETWERKHFVMVDCATLLEGGEAERERERKQERGRKVGREGGREREREGGRE